jgi:hypothetical protein
MGTAKATKAADKSQICRKFVLALQKLYGKSVPKIEMPVLETMLFGVCLEDNPWVQAEASLKKLMTSYFDVNEIRVSSISELEQTLAPLKDADWKGLRIRAILRYVFESTYSYDFEKLRRQTLEQALKTLKKIQEMSPFVRDFILHEILGSHVVCLDNSMLNAARWLGLVPLKSDQHDASEFLKGGLKKAEVSEFCHLLRCLATDPKFIPRFADMPDHELGMDEVPERLVELQNPPKKKPPRPVPPPEPPKPEKSAKKPVVPEKPAAKPAVASSKPAAAKASETKPVPKPAPKSAPPAKPAASKTPAKPPAKPVPAPAKKLPPAKPVTKKPGKK